MKPRYYLRIFLFLIGLFIVIPPIYEMLYMQYCVNPDKFIGGVMVWSIIYSVLSWLISLIILPADTFREVLDLEAGYWWVISPIWWIIFLLTFMFRWWGQFEKYLDNKFIKDEN